MKKCIIIFFFLAVTVQAQTNLIDSNQFSRFQQIINGTRERAKATQKGLWGDPSTTPGLGPGANPPPGTFVKDNEPHVVFTNTGAFIPDPNFPGFVIFDSSITNIFTNSIFEMGRFHPNIPSGFPATWPAIMSALYDVTMPFEHPYTVVTNEARSVIDIQTNIIGIVTNIMTNSQIEVLTRLSTAPFENLMRHGQIVQMDRTLYELMSFYGQEFVEQTFFFKIFDTASYFPGSFDGVNGVDQTRTGDEFFEEIQIGDTNTGFFTRVPSNAVTNLILGELVYIVTNSFTSNNVLNFEAGWFNTGINNRMFQSGFDSELTNKIVINVQAVFTNGILISGKRPKLIFLLADTNDTELAANYTVEIAGDVVDRQEKRVFFPPEISKSETLNIQSSPIDAGFPYSILTSFSVTNAPDIFTNLPIPHLNDKIHLVWNAEIPKFGALAFPIFKSDIDERFNLLTNMTINRASNTAYDRTNKFAKIKTDLFFTNVSSTVKFYGQRVDLSWELLDTLTTPGEITVTNSLFIDRDVFANVEALIFWNFNNATN